MSITPRRRPPRLPAVVAVATAAALALTACTTSPESGPAESDVSQEEIDAALEEGADLVFWAWGPQYEAVVDAFNEEYPNMNVELQNTGSGTDHYTRYQNVVAAGSDIPDVVQIEYTATPQFALTGSIIDLAEYGQLDLQDSFSASAWEASQYDGGLWGLPQDDGPLAMFYREDIFEEYDLEVPTTWEEYIEVGRELRAADPARYLAPDAGDAGLTNALIWQAGGRPYQVDGSSLTIDFTDEGTQRYIDTYSTLLEEELVDTANPGFTPEWNAGLANGTYATWIAGGWAAGTLQRRIPEAAGTWRVAPIPTYGDTDTGSAQQGGSLSSVTEASESRLASIGFVQWMSSSDEAAQIWVDLGGFPAASAQTGSEEWLNQEVEYFGDQQINQIFAESAAAAGEGWEFLPFQPYASSIFGDSAGQAYLQRVTLAEGLDGWRSSLVDYAESQGFDVAE